MVQTGECISDTVSIPVCRVRYLGLAEFAQQAFHEVQDAQVELLVCS